MKPQIQSKYVWLSVCPIFVAVKAKDDDRECSGYVITLSCGAIDKALPAEPYFARAFHTSLLTLGLALLG